ncbi:MAG: hypothetical protein M1569_03015 [Candidatus Marsarchaeota archaeon]|nr:hypothetical protein [Candidatus Marsarchaeota archaeon]MCL5413347.1 hypothetical protein [Candidatus Marsarchaeota archaeon]
MTYGSEIVLQYGGVKIGDGVVIGAKSLVTKNLDDYGIYAGIPAKLIRYRFTKKTINRLKRIKWWNMDHSLIIKNREILASKPTPNSLIRLEKLSRPWRHYENMRWAVEEHLALYGKSKSARLAESLSE